MNEFSRNAHENSSTSLTRATIFHTFLGNLLIGLRSLIANAYSIRAVALTIGQKTIAKMLSFELHAAPIAVPIRIIKRMAMKTVAYDTTRLGPL